MSRLSSVRVTPRVVWRVAGPRSAIRNSVPDGWNAGVESSVLASFSQAMPLTMTTAAIPSAPTLALARRRSCCRSRSATRGNIPWGGLNEALALQCGSDSVPVLDIGTGHRSASSSVRRAARALLVCPLIVPVGDLRMRETSASERSSWNRSTITARWRTDSCCKRDDDGCSAPSPAPA